MRKIFVLLCVLCLFFAIINNGSAAITTGSGIIQLTVVGAGLNVSVTYNNASYAYNIIQSGNAIYAGTNNGPNFLVNNIGSVPFQIGMSISNTGGAKLVTTGTPGTPITTGASNLRVAAVCCEWGYSLPLSKFTALDVLPFGTTPIWASGNQFGKGPLVYSNYSWANASNVAINNNRPFAFSIDAGPIPLGTKYNLTVYVQVR